MEAWKVQLGEEALQKGIISDPHWLGRLDDPMPVWAALQMLLQLMEKLEQLSSEYSSYD